jgi:Phytanoyl-CoA dioxygenase (PhyH)
MRLWASKAYRHYRDHGYQVFRKAWPTDSITAIADMARTQIGAYAGLIRRAGDTMDLNEFWPGTSLIKNAPLNAHVALPEGLEPLSRALRQLVTSSALADRLQELDGEDHYTIHQTILFMSAPSTEIHLDSWSVDTAPHGRAHTVWIPLQDMNPGSGVPSVISWPRERLVTEAALGLPEEGSVGERYDRYHQALAAKILGEGPEATTPLMRAGDFIVWSSLTPHFTLPSRPFPAERMALQVLVRPTRLIWGSFINQPSKWTIDRSVRINERFSLHFI